MISSLFKSLIELFLDTDSDWDDDFTMFKRKGSKIIFSDTESDNDGDFMSVKPSIPKASTSNSTSSSSNSTTSSSNSTAPIASTSDSNGMSNGE